MLLHISLHCISMLRCDALFLIQEARKLILCRCQWFAIDDGLETKNREINPKTAYWSKVNENVEWVKKKSKFLNIRTKNCLTQNSLINCLVEVMFTSTKKVRQFKQRIRSRVSPLNWIFFKVGARLHRTNSTNWFCFYEWNTTALRFVSSRDNHFDFSCKMMIDPDRSNYACSLACTRVRVNFISIELNEFNFVFHFTLTYFMLASMVYRPFASGKIHFFGLRARVVPHRKHEPKKLRMQIINRTQSKKWQ